MYSFSGNCAASVPISTFMCLWAIYIFLGSVLIFSCSRIGRPILGMYKSLTDTWMWKMGLWLPNFFSGNIVSEISVLCICSVARILADLRLAECTVYKNSHCPPLVYSISYTPIWIFLYPLELEPQTFNFLIIRDYPGQWLRAFHVHSPGERGGCVSPHTLFSFYLSNLFYTLG